jgi:hypothetical protein
MGELAEQMDELRNTGRTFFMFFVFYFENKLMWVEIVPIQIISHTHLVCLISMFKAELSFYA